MKIKDYILFLPPEDKQVIEAIDKKCKNSEWRSSFLEFLRVQFGKGLIDFWGSAIPKDHIDSSGSVIIDWRNLDIDWRSSFDGVTILKRSNTALQKLLKFSGLDVWILNWIFGTNLKRSDSRYENIRISRLVMTAAVLNY